MRRSVLAFALLFACGPQPAQRYGQPDAATLFGSAITRVTVEVDYARGAEPYTGNLGQVGDVWSLLRANLTRVFARGPKQLDVPSSLRSMEMLTDITATSFSTEQILEIADAHRNAKNTVHTATFYVVWLPGHFNDKGKIQPDVLGVSLSGTGVIAMFKQTIENSSRFADESSAMFVEQSTLIHEFGHTLGLVNNGIPLHTKHEDPSHTSHCTNPKCAMYWENDGTASAQKFARDFVSTGNEVLYGSECLGDIDALLSK